MLRFTHWANPKINVCTKNPRKLFLACMVETEVSHDTFLKFTMCHFEVVEVKGGPGGKF